MMKMHFMHYMNQKSRKTILTFLLKDMELMLSGGRQLVNMGMLLLSLNR